MDRLSEEAIVGSNEQLTAIVEALSYLASQCVEVRLSLKPPHGHRFLVEAAEDIHIITDRSNVSRYDHVPQLQPTKTFDSNTLEIEPTVEIGKYWFTDPVYDPDRGLRVKVERWRSRVKDYAFIPLLGVKRVTLVPDAPETGITL